MVKVKEGTLGDTERPAEGFGFQMSISAHQGVGKEDGHLAEEGKLGLWEIRDSAAAPRHTIPLRRHPASLWLGGTAQL